MKRSTKLLKTVTGAGRAKKTGWSTVALFIQYAIELTQKTKAIYRKQLIQLVQEWTMEIQMIAGYKDLIKYLERFFPEESPPNIRENSS